MLSACNFKANKTLEERLIIVFVVLLFVCFPHTYSIKLKSTYWTHSFFSLSCVVRELKKEAGSLL